MARLWVKFWYNDATRLILVLMGLHVIPTIFLLSYLGVKDPTVYRWTVIGQYMFVMMWAMIDNDYTQKNRYR